MYIFQFLRSLVSIFCHVYLKINEMWIEKNIHGKLGETSKIKLFAKLVDS